MASAKDWASSGRTLPAYPADHALGTEVPRGGSSCSSCRFRDGAKACGNSSWVDYPAARGGGGGDPALPAPADEYCCDLWERE